MANFNRSMFDLIKFGGAFMFLCYVAYHAVAGEHGIWAARQTAAEIEQLQRDIQLVTAEKRDLELRVVALGDAAAKGDAFADIVDIEMRYKLNVTHPLEVVIMRETPRRAD